MTTNAAANMEQIIRIANELGAAQDAMDPDNYLPRLVWAAIEDECAEQGVQVSPSYPCVMAIKAYMNSMVNGGQQ